MRLFLRYTFALQLLCLCLINNNPAQTAGSVPAGEKRIAVTIDDLPLNGPRIGLKREKRMTHKLLSAIRERRVPVVGFVNETQLYVPGETDERIALLKSWIDSGAELGNHTFSHIGFKDAPLARYQDDFVRGETVIRKLMSEKGTPVRYFRHPFLQMGPTAELERSFQDFLAERNYRTAPVTVDSMDWMFLSAYNRARREKDRKLLRQVSQDYLKLLDLRLQYSEQAAGELFGRPIDHILLLHANELNAENFEALLDVIEKRGYRFITLEQALADPAYKWPESYSPTSDWLSHWSQSRKRNYSPPQPPQYIVEIFKSGN